MSKQDAVIIAFIILVGAVASVECSLVEVIAESLFDVCKLFANAASDLIGGFAKKIFKWPDFNDIWTYVGLILASAVLYFGGKLLFVPINRIRLLGEVGYIPESSKMTMKDMVNMVRKRRMVGDVPPVYPNGWFAVIESRDLKTGEAKSVSCIGL